MGRQLCLLIEVCLWGSCVCGMRSLWEDNVVVMGSVQGLCAGDNVCLETV